MADTSDDLLADRRFAWAMAALADGDVLGATDLLDQVVERVPDWAPAWAALGDARERLGHSDASLDAWRRAATLDHDGRLGAALQVSRLESGVPASMPSAYIAALFDDYAPRFDRHLVEGLHYRGPALLAAALAQVEPKRTFGRALDLGCGTGLMARALAERAIRIDGVDLSPKMVALARQTKLYGDLAVAPLDEALARSEPESYDLIVAADVLVYIGDLSPVFAGACRALSPGGLLAFTLQTLTGSDEIRGFRLGSDLRFAHTIAYAQATLIAAGFKWVVLDEASTRTEKGRDVPGLVIVAHRA